MRLGIRTKLVALLTLVGLLPLTGALVTMVISGGNLRREAFGKMILTTASAESSELRWILVNNIENIELSLRDSRYATDLDDPNRRLSPREIERIERDWPSLTPSDPAVSNVLNHSLAGVLHRLQRHDEELVEILMTDRWGQLVAATGKTTDFYQADEPWWRETYNEGRGAVCIQDVSYDESAGVWSISLCVPVSSNNRVVGVVKAVLALEPWVGMLRIGTEQMSASPMLLREDGTVLFRQGVRPMGSRMDNWQGVPTNQGSWRATEEGEIQAFAPLRLPPRIGTYEVRGPDWLMGLYMPQSEAMGAVYRLGGVVLAIGLLIILAIFAIGIWLVERSIVKRIRILAGATMKISEGNFEHRVAGEWGGRRLLGRDEIDDLATDFNQMVDTVQSTHDQLRAANDLKEDFIKIAGHELRTPVTYILATAKLLADSEDTERLKKALETISFKTRRLNKIIQAMFKLMPGPEGLEEMIYEQVDLRELLQEVFLDSQHFVERRDQKLFVDFAENLPRVVVDRDKLYDIVLNLVMNAVKFTPNEGTVRVHLGLQLGDYVCITVQDEGPGVSEEEMPHIFKPFFCGTDVMKHSTGWSGYQKRGIGLGLAVVKHFVDLHCGEIRVTNNEIGAKFVVTIPVRPRVGDEPEEDPPPNPRDNSASS
ncbi:MAG: ATP-binding protein [Planctomycetota bacterium]